MTEKTRLVVDGALGGERLDRAVAALTGLSRRRARGLIDAGHVRRNGEVVRVQSRMVDVTDVLELELPGAEAAPSPPEVVPFPLVVYEDAWLVVASKPAGELSQSANHAPGERAFDRRLAMAMAQRDGRPPFLRLVHRLDRATSGLLVFAARPEALAPVTAAWRQDRVDRRYLAVVEGSPPWSSRTLDGPVARDPDHRWRFQVADHGRPARTQVEVVAVDRERGITAVSCRLSTGRTHQVRVHLAAAGLPVVGDRLYGSTRSEADRLMLHAAQLRLPHPEHGQTLDLQDSLPAAMAEWWPRPATSGEAGSNP